MVASSSAPVRDVTLSGTACVQVPTVDDIVAFNVDCKYRNSESLVRSGFLLS